MATPGSQNVQLTTTSYVDICAAPTSNQRSVVVNLANTSSTAVQVTVAYDDNGTVRVLAPAQSIPGNDWVQLGGFVLDTTTRKLKAKLSATGTVDVVCSYSNT